MDIRSALKRQYGAGLAMLRQEVERCPEAVWTSGEHPRNFWRIAFHAVFYTHLYLQPNLNAFVPWEKDREDSASLWEDPPVVEPYTRSEILDYIDLVTAGLDKAVDLLDLDSDETGFYWYKNMAKLDHQMMNLRHLQGHVGQLSEILMAKGIDLDWVGQSAAING
ncbi:MAG: hypothetical protein ACR2HJ_00255 [Fimbriimonadales bacterium]